MLKTYNTYTNIIIKNSHEKEFIIKSQLIIKSSNKKNLQHKFDDFD